MAVGTPILDGSARTNNRTEITDAALSSRYLSMGNAGDDTDLNVVRLPLEKCIRSFGEYVTWHIVLRYQILQMAG